MKLTFWGRVWVVWAVLMALLLIWFLVFEALALFHKAPGDTLSEQIWWLRNHGHWLYFVVLDVWFLGAVALGWSLFHFQHQGPGLP